MRILLDACRLAMCVGVVVVLVLLLAAALGLWWSRRSKGKQAEDTIGFTNSFYSVEEEGSSGNNNQGQVEIIFVYFSFNSIAVPRNEEFSRNSNLRVSFALFAHHKSVDR